jgi:hypothetical protein
MDRLHSLSCSKGEYEEELVRRVYRSSLDIRSSNNLRRKNSENKILLDLKFQELKSVKTRIQSNIHHNTIKTIYVNPSIMETSASETNKMKMKMTFIKQEVSKKIT